MLADFQKHIKTHLPDVHNQHIAVAISGGVDSVVLASLLQEAGVKISLLHCNFKLRAAESEKDQIFVQQLAENMQVPFFDTAFKTQIFAAKNKLSIQVAARQLRYTWFNEILEKNNLDAIATAHHADDNLETFLINMLRGTGIAGLTGIPMQNATILRPLLPFSKEQIIAYAKKNNLQWREDASNQETKYLRNKLRHDVVPVLKEIQPAVLQNLETTLKYLQQSNAFVKEVVDQKRKTLFVVDEITNGYKIDVKKLKQESHLDLLIFELFTPYGFTAFADIKNVMDAQTGKKIISTTHILLKNREFLLLYPLKVEDSEITYQINEDTEAIVIDDFMLRLTVGNKFIEKGQQNKSDNLKSILLDINAISFPINVRKKKKGDYFYPAGMQGKKKLSKFFKDEKMSQPEKEKTWLLCAEKQLIWVVGKRVDRRFLATPKTENILKITYEKI